MKPSPRPQYHLDTRPPSTQVAIEQARQAAREATRITGTQVQEEVMRHQQKVEAEEDSMIKYWTHFGHIMGSPKQPVDNFGLLSDYTFVVCGDNVCSHNVCSDDVFHMYCMYGYMCCCI